MLAVVMLQTQIKSCSVEGRDAHEYETGLMVRTIGNLQ